MRPRFTSFRTPARWAVLATAVAAVGVTGTAVAVTGDPAAPAGTVVAAHSGKCLTEPSAGNLRQEPCTGSDRQRFTVTGGVIRNAASGTCVEATGGPRGVRMSACDGRAGQRFTLRPAGAAGVMLVAERSGRCLDVFAGRQDDRAPVIEWPCGDPATAGSQVWRIAEAQAPAVASAPATTAPSTPPAAEPGTARPPDGAELSRAYRIATSEKGYAPRDGECSADIHARYWTYGPDGKVYPTWHPAQDPATGCAFGHEHGDDPRTSELFPDTGWLPFGYANEMLAPSDPARQRDEDHVGHKITVRDGVEVHRNDSGQGRAAPDTPVTMVCDTLLKLHQGTHSGDALTNNLHELSHNVRCTRADTGAVVATRITALTPIGDPGGFRGTDCPGPGFGSTRHDHVGDAVPADSPSGGGGFGRLIPDAACATAVAAGAQRPGGPRGIDGRTTLDTFDLHEFWFAAVHGQIGSGASRTLNVQLAPMFYVLDPARYHDPERPQSIGRSVDLCFAGAPGVQCDLARAAARRDKVERIAWDDVRSPFRGTTRQADAGTFIVQNHTGSTRLYTDAYGRRFATEPFPGAIEQFVQGDSGTDRTGTYIRGESRDFAAAGGRGFPANPYRIHAPN